MSSIALAVLTLACSAQPRTVAERGRPPRFEDYPVIRTWTGEPTSPDLSSHPDASRFGAALWQGARRGPNFAGHYTIVSRRCGRLCREFVIVDAVTGRVHPGLSDTPPFEYRPDSRLIAFNAPESGGAYFVWNDPRLEIVSTGSRGDSPVPPVQLRGLIDSLREEERTHLREAGPMVLRETWDRLVISTRDGTPRVLRDRIAEDTMVQLHVFRGAFATSGQLVVETISPDGSLWRLIDPESGRVTAVEGPVAVPRLRRQVGSASQ